jgi:phosphoribosylanthranilate isomerase
MGRVRVKICGVTTPEIAAAAAAAGADAVGLIFAESRRRVTVAQAARIVAALPPFISAVGVFVDAPADEVLSLAHGIPLDAVQLHGEEPPETVAALRGQGLRVLKAIRVGDRIEPVDLERYRGASALLFDAKADGLAGGSGRAFDWHLARGLGDRCTLILSGGLTPENVLQALEIVRPFAVDVSSGVEAGGAKDPERIRQFIGQVRRWESTQP